MNRSVIAVITITAAFTACSNSSSRSGELSEAESAAFEAQVAKLKARPLQNTSPRPSSPFKGRLKSEKPFTVRPYAASDGVQPELAYNGGPMLESVELYAIYWGTTVNPATVSGIPGMLSTVHGAGSPYMSMLQLYNATTPYTIGDGVYKGSIVDADAPMPANGVIDDSLIRGELARLIDSGQLPPNNGRNLYMVYFPLKSGANNISITHGSEASCSSFCAYHNTYVRNGSNVYYGVMPDLDDTGPCGAGDCGGDTALNNLYATTTHEVTEAITDAAVGLAQFIGPPLAWYDPELQDGEIGDICAYIDDTSGGYHVQTEWLNPPVQGCSAHPPTGTPDNLTWDNSNGTGPDGSFIVVPSGGTSVAATISVNSTGGAGAVQLSGTTLGTALVPTFTPATITPGGTESSSVTYTAVAGLVTQAIGPLQFEGLDADGITHLIKPTVIIVGPAPTITSIVPATGKTQGEAATLNGTKFGVGSTVTVQGASDTNPVPVTFTRVSSTKLTLSMPGHKAEAVTLKVTNLDGANATTTYTYTAGDAPTVTAVSPATGPFGGGTFVTITGTNFSSTSQMTIGGVAMDCDPASPSQDCQFNNATTAIAITPAFQGGANPVNITVTNADGQSGTGVGAAAQFTYADNTTPPVISSLSATMGPTIGGTYVTIYGSNFGPSPVVKFGGTTATVTTSNDSFLGVFTPAHAAGAVNVVVINPDLETATAAMQFTYVASSAPTITDISPTFGDPAGGATVVITGTGFANDADVTFGGATAFVHPGGTSTQLTVTSPAHAAGSVNVVVKNGDGQTATTTFLYGVPPDMSGTGGSGGGGGGGTGGTGGGGGGGGTGGVGGGGGGGTGGTGGGGGGTPADDLSVGAPDDMSTGGGGGGGGGGTGGTGGGGGGKNGGCSAAGSSGAPASSAVPFVGLALLGFGLRRRSRRS